LGLIKCLDLERNTSNKHHFFIILAPTDTYVGRGARKLPVSEPSEERKETEPETPGKVNRLGHLTDKRNV